MLYAQIFQVSMAWNATSHVEWNANMVYVTVYMVIVRVTMDFLAKNATNHVLSWLLVKIVAMSVNATRNIRLGVIQKWKTEHSI